MKDIIRHRTLVREIKKYGETLKGRAIIIDDFIIYLTKKIIAHKTAHKWAYPLWNKNNLEDFGVTEVAYSFRDKYILISEDLRKPMFYHSVVVTDEGNNLTSWDFWPFGFMEIWMERKPNTKEIIIAVISGGIGALVIRFILKKYFNISI